MRIRKNNKPQDPIEFLATNVQSGGVGASQSGSIVELDSLPSLIPWESTALPADDTVVENIYFNQALSIEETVKILEEADLPFQSSTIMGDIKISSSYITVPGFTDELKPYIYSVVFIPTFNIWAIGDITALLILGGKDSTEDINNHILFISKAPASLGITFNGWNKSIEMPIVYNYPIFSKDIHNAIINTQGALPHLDKLSSLISSTPFIKNVPNFSTSTIYKVKEYNTTVEFKGVPVPNTGYVEKIYINKNYDMSKVKTFTEKYATPENDGYAVYFSLGENDSVSALMFGIVDGALYIIHATDNEKIIYDENNGWNLESDFVEIKREVLSEMAGIQIGTYNNEISDFISAPPFEEITTLTPTGTYSYYVFNGQYFKRLDNIQISKEDEAGVVIISRTLNELDISAIKLTADEINIMFNEPHVLLEVTISPNIPGIQQLHFVYTKSGIYYTESTNAVTFTGPGFMEDVASIIIDQSGTITIDQNSYIRRAEFKVDTDILALHFFENSSDVAFGASLFLSTTPTQGDSTPITSDGVYKAIGDINSILDAINGEEV